MVAAAVVMFLSRGCNTLQPIYNTVRYNTVLHITRFKDGSQKCIDYIEKMTINGHFQYNLYIFVWI